MTSSWTRSALPAVALAALAGLAGAQRIKLATLVPDGSIWDRTLKQMGATWREKTDGRVSLNIFAGGVAGDEDDMVRKLRIGQLQACLFTASGLGQVEPGFRVFEIPLLFEDEAEFEHVLENLMPLLEARLEKEGYKLIHWAHAGWVRIFSSKPIRSYDDFIGMKQFVWGGGTRVGKWYEEKGIRTVPLSAPDILTGLQTGLVEVVPATPLAVLSLQWFRSAPYMFERRLAPLVGGTIVSERTWKKVAPEDQQAMLAAGERAQETLFREVPASEQDALREMRNRGLQVTEARAEDQARWDGLARHFQDRMRTDSVPPEIFDRVQELLREFRAGRRASGSSTARPADGERGG